MYWSRNSENVLFLILLAVLFLPASLSAQEQSAGIWKVDSAATLEIDAHDTCKEITNNHASGQPMMVPTGSSTQWSTFLSNLPAGVTADDCSGGGGPVMLTYSGATKSEADCTGASGSVVSTPGGTLCRFTGTSCVSGWAKADNWSTTTTRTASCNSVAVPAEAFTCK